MVELADVGEELHEVAREADVLEATTTSVMKCSPVDRSPWVLVWVSNKMRGEAGDDD